MHVTIVSACNVIQNMKQLCLRMYLFIEYRTSLHAMAARCSQSQPTQDTQQNDMKCNRRILQTLYFIMITTATYLWNKPQL